MSSIKTNDLLYLGDFQFRVITNEFSTDGSSATSSSSNQSQTMQLYQQIWSKPNTQISFNNNILNDDYDNNGYIELFQNPEQQLDSNDQALIYQGQYSNAKAGTTSYFENMHNTYQTNQYQQPQNYNNYNQYNNKDQDQISYYEDDQDKNCRRRRNKGLKFYAQQMQSPLEEQMSDQQVQKQLNDKSSNSYESDNQNQQNDEVYYKLYSNYSFERKPNTVYQYYLYVELNKIMQKEKNQENFNYNQCIELLGNRWLYDLRLDQKLQYKKQFEHRDQSFSLCQLDQKKDKEAKVKVKSAFKLFKIDNIVYVKQQHPQMSPQDRSELLKTMWKNLKSDKKVEYVKNSRLQKQIALQEKKQTKA